MHIMPVLLLISLFTIVSAGKAASEPNESCPTKCGSVTIPYPFGITQECSLDDSFLITCKQHSPFLGTSNVTVLSISLDGLLRISTSVAYDCYNKKGVRTNSYFYHTFNLSHFHISSTRNKLFAIGCDTVGLIGNFDFHEENVTTGCVSLCTEGGGSLINGSCNGFGCCQASIPPRLSSFLLASISVYNHTSVYDFNRCGYAFLAEEGTYEFRTTDLRGFEEKRFGGVLDWAVGNESCREAERNLERLACKAEHSECVDSESGIGYRCKCSQGYEGNPYLIHGCQDIDECKELNKCNENATCINFNGGYKCPCRDGYEGDGMTSGGMGCHLKVNGDSRLKTLLVITLSVTVSVLGFLIGSIYIYWGMKKRKLVKMREKFFLQNGGILLQQQIARHRGSSETAKVFTATELMTATNNFDERRVLGQGGHGTVYKGVLPNDTVVAVKKSRICDKNQIEEFINEVTVLSQINHRNVVKLLGCCLETEVPLLVYEFINAGTLSDHLHRVSQSSNKLSWAVRLRIATEVAGALAYLHSATSTPIIHRDVKTSNILLDHNLTAKISDFGASRFVPLDQSQLTTLVQGTLGYLDPEYFHTSQLTEKSDVYSFGVVMAELLTSKKALCFERDESFRNLSRYFVWSVKEGQLLHIVDRHILDDEDDGGGGGNAERIEQVADLAKRCLRVKGGNRPSMKEVAMELEGLGKHPWGHANVSLEETEYLLNPFSPAEVDHVSGIGGATGIESSNQISVSLQSGR